MKWYQKILWKTMQFTFKHFSMFYLKRWATEIEVIEYNEEPKDKPFLILANHCSIEDGIIVGNYTSQVPLYITNLTDNIFQTIFAKLVGYISKNMDPMDFSFLTELIDRIKNKKNVCIFLEGDMSWDGETINFDKSIARLIKILKIPVRMMKITGSYLLHPRWSKKKRKGKIIVELKTMSVDKINSSTKATLHKKIYDFIYCNNIKECLSKSLTFNSKDVASDIHFLLWLCPNCKEIDSVYGKDNTIICANCNNKWNLNANLEIHANNTNIKDLKDWYDFQKQSIRCLMSSSTNEDVLFVSKDIILYYGIFYKKKRYSDGDIVFYKDRFIFIPNDGNKKQLVFKLSKVVLSTVDIKKYFLFCYCEKKFTLNFNGKNSIKIKLFIDAFCQ